jgi:hypothetical protein
VSDVTFLPISITWFDFRVSNRSGSIGARR